MTTERELIDELRTELGRVRAALVESMDWGWSVYIPPDEVLARCEAALGLADTIAEFFCLGVVSPSEQRTPHQGTHRKAA